MKALKLNSIILIGMIMVTGSCEKNKMNPCVKGVLVETVGNCYLIIQVLNAPIGNKYTYIPPYRSRRPQQTYSNAVSTSLSVNANYGDTIYFNYQPPGKGNCPFGPGAGLVDLPNVPPIKILAYSLKNCP